MAITLSGRLYDPYGNALPDASIRFRAARTGTQIIANYSAEATTDSSGDYTISVRFGTYHIDARQSDADAWYTIARSIPVTSETTSTTVNDLIVAYMGADDATPEIVLEIEALVAEASEAADRAESTLSSRPLWALDLSGARSLATQGLAYGQRMSIATTGRAGEFYWNPSDLSSEVALDTQSGVYVAPSSAPGGESGAWVRVVAGIHRAEWYGVDTGDSTVAMKAAIEHAGFVTLSTETSLSEMEVSDSELSCKIIGLGDNAKINLVSVASGGSAYTDYFTGATLKFITKSFSMTGVEIDYPAAGAELTRVYLSAIAERVYVSRCGVGYGKLALSASKSLTVAGNYWDNETFGSVTTRNAALYTQVTSQSALHIVTRNSMRVYPSPGDNVDIVKCSNTVTPEQQPMIFKNNFHNLSPNAQAQVDLYIGAFCAEVERNIFHNTQIHRKSNQVDGVTPDVRGSSVSSNIFRVTDGFYNATNDFNACIYFAGGRGDISNNKFFVDSYVSDAIIYLQAGAEAVAGQDSNLTSIKGNHVFAANAQEGVLETERFILRNTSQAGYEGSVQVSGNIVYGMKRFCNLGVDNYSVVDNNHWMGASPTGQAVDCGTLTNFYCDAQFEYAANRASNVVNGKPADQYIASSATLDIEGRNLVMVNDASTTITDLSNYNLNMPVTIINNDSGSSLSINVPGAPVATLARYEAITIIPYRLEGSTTIRFAKVV